MKRKKIFFLFLKVNFLFIIAACLKDKKNIFIKVCICTIGKEENRYIREFVEYYKNLGVDKIFLYDNNKKNGEHFEDSINDYIDKEFVKVFNWRGIKKPHFKAINDCYLRYNTQYDWLIFYDIDEYIHLKNYKNIKFFLNQKKFNKCKKIYLNWVMHTDNDHKFYRNLSLFKRFPKIEKDALFKNQFSQKVKTIIRGNISNFVIANNSHTTHIITESVSAFNGFGKKINLDKEFYLLNSDYKYYYIDHFYTKSLEEFVKKIKRGSAVKGKNARFILFRIIRYFIINKFSFNKYEYLLKHLGRKFIV